MHEVENSSRAVVRAQAFDWWFSQFTGCYDLLLKLVLAKRLRKALPHIRGPRVLEVSFGLGYLMSLYAGRFQTSGIDYNPRYVETARRRLQALGLRPELAQGDAHALPFAADSFDTLVNTDAFTLYKDPRLAMSEFYRVLAPAGRLILMEYDYPSDRNWWGTFKVNWARRMKVPYIDFGELLRSAGFEYEDHAVGGTGMMHMFIATKRAAEPARAPAV